VKKLLVAVAVLGFVAGVVVALRYAPANGQGPDVVGKGVAWAMLLMSTMAIWVGMAERQPHGRMLAASSSMMLVGATGPLLQGTVPEAVLLSLQGLGMAMATVWFVSAYRVSRAWRKRRALDQPRP
jgi:hypothetical protein